MSPDSLPHDLPSSAYAEAAVEDSLPNKDNFRHLAEALPEIVWTSDPDGIVDFMSDQWGHFSGIPDTDPNYLNWSVRVHPQDLKKLEQQWSHCLKSGEIYEQEFRIRSVSGEYCWFSSRAIPVLNTNREIVKWYGVTTNVDQRKKMELRLREISEQKDTFLAMLGHELRNPLAVIATSYELLNRREAAKEQKDVAFNLLGQQIRHLSRLVDDTLDVSRLSSGKLRLSLGLVDINRLVETGITHHLAGAREKEITIESKLHQSPVWTNGDEVRLTQCLTNLLDNALKFTDPGGLIRVSTTVRGESAIIEVQDSGMGMTPEELCRIFEPFEQGLGAQKFSTSGLGLGLAVIENLVHLHGGKFSAKSPGRGQGTTFSMSLKSTSPPLPEESGTDLPPAPGQTRRILILEDNESVAQMLKMFFELEAHTVRVAHTGTDALHMLADEIPDVFISDLTLPGSMNGWEIAKKICDSYPPEKRPFLVALSGHTQPGDQEKSKLAGFDEHLAKPPTPGQLREVLFRAPEMNHHSFDPAEIRDTGSDQN